MQQGRDAGRYYAIRDFANLWGRIGLFGLIRPCDLQATPYHIL